MSRGIPQELVSESSAGQVAGLFDDREVRGARLAQRVIGILPGEGIGPEVVGAAVDVLRAATSDALPRIELRFDAGPIGEAALATGGAALSPQTAAFCEGIFAEGGAVLCGPGGARFVYDLRARFDLYCKLVPIRPRSALRDVGVVRPSALEGVDLLVVRENCGGVYFGRTSEVPADNGRSRRVQHTFGYDGFQVRRILEAAVTLAQRRTGRLSLVVKPAASVALAQLWTESFAEVTARKDLETRVLEVDNACYQIIAAAREFDVVVTSNLFGDVLADCAALLLGSRGMSYSGNFSGRGSGVFQTGHGAARDLAGKDTANPLGQILSVAMLLRESFGMTAEADRIERAVERVLEADIRTVDIAGPGSTVVGTRQMGRLVAAAVEDLSEGPPSHSSDALPAAVVNGRSLFGAAAFTVERRNPANWSEVLSHVCIAEREDVRRASHAASAVQREWARESPASRTALLARWAGLLAARSDELARLVALETGKPLHDAFEELGRARAHIESAVRLFGRNQTELIDSARAVRVSYQPRGVVGLITPWNNPVAIPVSKLAAALALGNAVIWKPAVEAPKTALFVLQALRDADIPPALVNLLFGGSATGRHLIRDPAVRAVALTGGISTGRSAALLCARLGKPLQGELGGNNAALVLGDCDVRASARELASAAFSFAGQRCTAIRRMIVERSVLPLFRDEFVSTAMALRIGQPDDRETRIGPLVSLAHVDRVRGQLVRGLAEGATLVCGGNVPSEFQNGCWLTPAVVETENPNGSLVQEETFGPVAVIQPADDLDHAIRLANGVEQGLVAALYANHDEVRRHCVQSLEAGILNLAGGPLRIHADAPFCGWKASGIGPPEHGHWDREFYCVPQAIYGWRDPQA